MMYASEQAPSILCCKRKFLESAKFVELLFHQDVNVFYSHTAQLHMPPWSNSHTGVFRPPLYILFFFCSSFQTPSEVNDSVYFKGEQLSFIV